MKKLIISVFILLLGILIIMIIFKERPESIIKEKMGVKEINIEKITKGKAYIDATGVQFISTSIRTVFDYEGWYKGEYFKREFVKEGILLMRISPEIKPNDGVIEGFIIETIENEEPIIYIFLDQDWKNKIKETIIYWGKSFNNQKEFNFSNQISPGIYIDKVKDEKERFLFNYSMHLGGVYVGDLETKTLIAFY